LPAGTGTARARRIFPATSFYFTHTASSQETPVTHSRIPKKPHVPRLTPGSLLPRGGVQLYEGGGGSKYRAIERPERLPVVLLFTFKFLFLIIPFNNTQPLLSTPSKVRYPAPLRIIFSINTAFKFSISKITAYFRSTSPRRGLIFHPKTLLPVRLTVWERRRVSPLSIPIP